MARVERNVETLGQVFTPGAVVDQMLGLIHNRPAGDWRCLEPSAGDGAFFNRLPGAIGIEIDADVAPANAMVQDFFPSMMRPASTRSSGTRHLSGSRMLRHPLGAFSMYPRLNQRSAAVLRAQSSDLRWRRSRRRRWRRSIPD